MNMYLQLAISVQTVILFTVGLKAIEKNTKLHKLAYWKRQIIVGVIMGIMSACGTIFGVTSESGAVINVRDAAPLCAGLVFGGPAGVIAGFIGGLHRYLSPIFGANGTHPFLTFLWGNAGTFTQLACSLSTFCAGIFAWILREIVFGGKHGKWYYGFISGLFVESFHMLMVFLTNFNEVEKAYNVVIKCVGPMIICTSLATVLSLIGVALLYKEPLVRKVKPIPLSSLIQLSLMSLIITGFVIVSAFVYGIFQNLANTSAEETLKASITDVETEITTESDSKMLSMVEEVALVINNGIRMNQSLTSLVNTLLDKYTNIDEINIIDKDNYIAVSSNKEYVINKINMQDEGYEQANEFIVLNRFDDEYTGYVSYIQPFMRQSYNESFYMKYAGYVLEEGDKYAYVQIGCNADHFHNSMDAIISKLTTNRHVGQSGFIGICNSEYKIISCSNHEEYVGIRLDIDELSLEKIGMEIFSNTLYNYYIEEVESYYVIAVIPAEEANLDMYVSISITMLQEIVIFTIMYFMIYSMIMHTVVNNLHHVNDKLELITAGNLDTVVESNGTKDMEELSTGINKTVGALKGYIEAEATKNEAELNFAKRIQASALPSTFPAYPSYSEFDIFASMQTAKEVGGDFYDFYLVDPRHLIILIADVSGKGMPAGMFMMQSKTIIKSLVETGLSVNDAFTQANKKLCEGNEAQMFVTAWMACIDLDTGHVEYVNAGHNPPLVKRGEKFEYLKTKVGFVLAGMDCIRYQKQELDLAPGDQIFLYTDGVTEATSKDVKLYSDPRLEEVINRDLGLDAEALCYAIKNDVAEFTEGAEQSDDITMLSFQYFGKRNLKNLVVDATIPNVETITNFVDEFLEANDCPMKVETQINVVIDEIFSNIAFYAYPNQEEPGKAKVCIEYEEKDSEITLTFEDHGIEYDPLAKDDPDITLSAEERTIGGLGIFMVKKMMDSMYHYYKNGRNVLIIKKKIK